jgi:hypothetical protein
MIGVSFYLNDPLAERRLAEAKAKGVTRAFTSLHIPEESGDLANRAKALLQAAGELKSIRRCFVQNSAAFGHG